MRVARALARAALPLALWVSAGCDGCDREPEETARVDVEASSAPDPELTLGLPPEVASRRVAIVEGQEITVLDVARELDDMGTYGSARAADAERRRLLVEAMVDEAALAAEARDRGLDRDPRVTRAREEIAMRALVAHASADVAPPTDEQVRAFYDAHRDRYRVPERRSASLIFTRDREAAAEAIPAIQGELRRRSELWMATADRIGFAGPRRQPRIETELFAAVARPGEAYVPQLVRDAAFATEPGSLYPEPVEVDDGWFIVRVMERIEPNDTPFEAVRDAIRQELHDEAIDAYVTSLVAETLSQASFDDAALEAVRIPEEAVPEYSAPSHR